MPTAKAKEVAPFVRNRITGHGTMNPAAILAHPKNYRQHDCFQRDALDGLLEEVGCVSNVIVNKKSGRLLDGHFRVDLAEKRGAKRCPWCSWSSPAEEDLVLAMLDPLGDLAGMMRLD